MRQRPTTGLGVVLGMSISRVFNPRDTGVVIEQALGQGSLDTPSRDSGFRDFTITTHVKGGGFLI